MSLSNWTKSKGIILTSLFICIGIVLPMVFHSFSMAGNMFLPMHIPVILCAIVCREKWGAFCGFLVPIISSFLTGMPPIFPVAIVMSFELACYGAILPILIKKYNIYVSLIITLFIGRIFACIVNFFILGVVPSINALITFIGGLFITALPGIIIQLILIPILYKFLKKRGLVNE